MRITTLLAVLFALGLATVVSAQDNTVSFYEKQARKDAQLEQSSTFSSLEDEKDFWYDQARYEKDLKTQDSKAYNIYMKAKRLAYSEHAESCKNQCIHSDYYYKQASFYFTYKDNQNLSKEAVGEIVQVASPRIF
ncbi:hypothetical protein Murru_1634 [Allomuricauda ruestringensis DSM 13258]|uniref:Secreted protein n=1 Tax=Allomuricauda ruestringensis (strain DSM 13258 / CIP 107369 / LMG 19739 / B1) TaxID=886377 RepID=G2PIG0_ALLRU|nr:hypothetical protein [Allomuricauda ruestringensis]AEM70674.1 hypothetical protein Murru_1634 [Allomuricauda ruestringensis DSM 13258]